MNSEWFSPLFQQGLAGVVIIGLGIAVVYLFKDSRNKDKRYDDLQEKRLGDAIETKDKLVNLIEEQRELPERIYNLVIRKRKDE